MFYTDRPCMPGQQDRAGERRCFRHSEHLRQQRCLDDKMKWPLGLRRKFLTVRRSCTGYGRGAERRPSAEGGVNFFVFACCLIIFGLSPSTWTARQTHDSAPAVRDAGACVPAEGPAREQGRCEQLAECGARGDARTAARNLAKWRFPTGMILFVGATTPTQRHNPGI